LEVKVSNDPGVTAGRDVAPADYLLPPRLTLPDATPDPELLASRVLRAVVPSFADGAAVFVLERLLSGDPAEPAVTGPAEPLVRRLAAGSAPAAAQSAFPAGEVIALPADSPLARCVREGDPVIFTDPGGAMRRRISRGARMALGRYAAFLAAPVIIRGTTAGFLVLARGHAAPAFRDIDGQAAADLAARVGVALGGSLALMRRRSVAEALVPPRPAVSHVAPGQLEIAGRCLPATGYDSGGDWYDIIPLPGDRTGLIVGDVMGHGPEAATVMTRLSAAAFTLADLDLPPAEVMRQLNRTAIALPQATLATCAYAVIDPGSRSCAIATAGHLPPVLAMPDGTTRIPDLAGGQSLGVTPASYGQAHIRLRPGTVLALYTDGLVETRTRSFDQGIVALRSALSGQRPDLDATCEEIVTALGEGNEDDITVVLARVPGG
jgi:Stage II sporulation protein E (SpoIIE)/GAF domain